MAETEFADAAVASAFEAFPGPVKNTLSEIRGLIFKVARETPGVGPLQEALRWGQPSYLTPQSGSGSTIRLGFLPAQPRDGAVFFHCQSGLVDEFRTIYGRELAFSGNRAILVPSAAAIPVAPLRHCLALALTHHLRKRAMPGARK